MHFDLEILQKKSRPSVGSKSNALTLLLEKKKFIYRRRSKDRLWGLIGALKTHLTVLASSILRASDVAPVRALPEAASSQRRITNENRNRIDVEGAT